MDKCPDYQGVHISEVSLLRGPNINTPGSSWYNVEYGFYNSVLERLSVQFFALRILKT